MSKFSGASYGPTKLVYNGSALRYTDKDSNLLPYTDYQYSVTALNNVGKVSSLWEVVSTKEAPPDSVPAPAINVSNHTSNFKSKRPFNIAAGVRPRLTCVSVQPSQGLGYCFQIARLGHRPLKLYVPFLDMPM